MKTAKRESSPWNKLITSEALNKLWGIVHVASMEAFADTNRAKTATRKAYAQGSYNVLAKVQAEIASLQNVVSRQVREQLVVGQQKTLTAAPRQRPSRAKVKIKTKSRAKIADSSRTKKKPVVLHKQRSAAKSPRPNVGYSAQA